MIVNSTVELDQDELEAAILKYVEDATPNFEVDSIKIYHSDSEKFPSIHNYSATVTLKIKGEKKKAKKKTVQDVVNEYFPPDEIR